MEGMYQYILDCDLLIIDDLGIWRLNNSFTVAAVLLHQ